MSEPVPVPVPDLNIYYENYDFNFKVLNKSITNKGQISSLILDGVLQNDNKNIILSTYKLDIIQSPSGFLVEANFSNEYIIFKKTFQTNISLLDANLLPEIEMISTNNMKKDIELKIFEQVDADNIKITMKLLKPLLYLANNTGFNPSYVCALNNYIELLSSIGYEVIEPFRINNKVDFSDRNWIWKVNNDDILDAQVCDVIFCVYNGIAPDEGIVVEASYGFKSNSAVYYFRDDIRSLTRYDVPMNIMLFSSYNPNTWEQYYYTNVDDIVNPERLLVTDFHNYLFNKNKNKLPIKSFSYNNYDRYN